MYENQLPRIFESVIHMLAEAAELAPENTALICDHRRLNYLEYGRCVARFAEELVGLGARNSRVVLICSNSIEIAIATLAGYAAGMQVVPINPIYTARELTYILKDAEPSIVIYDVGISSTVVPLLSNLKLRNSIDVGKGGRLLDHWRDDETAILSMPFPTRDELAVLQYTGGTTGYPKGVNITHGQMSVNISQRECSVPTRPEEERVLCVMPLFHVFATSMCLHLTVYCRGTLVILNRYHPADTLAALGEEKITLFPAGPTVFNGLLSYDGFEDTDFSKLRRCVSGSAPLAEETLNSWQMRTCCPILEGYGQTESGPVITMFRDNETPIPKSVGKPLPLTMIQVVDIETGERVLNPGKQGEIRVQGPQIMSGYRNLPNETAQALRDGWLYTGDIGEQDENGNIFIRDRKKDLAIVGGYNVYPREIDDVLKAHPAVVEAAAIGVNDVYWGEIIEAYVVLKQGMNTSLDHLDRYCRENLAKYKVPSKIILIDEIPKTTVGKINKTALKRIGKD